MLFYNFEKYSLPLFVWNIHTDIFILPFSLEEEPNCVKRYMVSYISKPINV